MSSRRSHRSNASADVKLRTPTSVNNKVQFAESSASNRSYKFDQNANNTTKTSQKPNFNDINRKYDIIMEKEKVRVGQYVKTETPDVKITHTSEALKTF